MRRVPLGAVPLLRPLPSPWGMTRPALRNSGLFAKHPVDLGSRCTVFMNSSVKQAQKEGATIEDISAGLSMSVTKNAIYKVIRAVSKEDLGTNIVVQGGTFLNDAILRSFELEVEQNVIRPSISGLMGAYGAALYAQELRLDQSALMTLEELEHFTHTSKTVSCGLCNNNCNLTVNTFSGGRRFISGNRCEKPLGRKENKEIPNMFAWKLSKAACAEGCGRGTWENRHPDGAEHVREHPVLVRVFDPAGL